MDIKRKKREHRKKRRELEGELGDMIDKMDPEEHVAVVNTETGEMLTGSDAPTASQVEEWLAQNLKYVYSSAFMQGFEYKVYCRELCLIFRILILILSLCVKVSNKVIFLSVYIF